jgi:hypothetical protein
MCVRGKVMKEGASKVTEKREATSQQCSSDEDGQVTLQR